MQKYVNICKLMQIYVNYARFVEKWVEGVYNYRWIVANKSCGSEGWRGD